ncbi:hypothetical protein B0H19DRAFT_1346460 [Mycena capillaripes]|nr:hypothetical protein B0H19DRAFT_1346460 [Mycena capillaripes]
MSDPTSSVNGTQPVIIVVNSVTAIGPFFFGHTFNWLLLGVLWMQLYAYSRNFPKDKLYIKILVYTVFTLDVLQSAFTSHTAWWYMIQNWGNASALQSVPWTAAVIPIACGLISAPVQIFYAFRIWVLRTSPLTRILAVLIAVLGFAQSLTGIVASALIEKNLSQENLIRLHPYFTFWLAGAFTTDIMIACSMVWILQTAKASSRIAQTDGLLNRLILNTVQTGTVTVIGAGLDLAMFVRFTDTNYHFILYVQSVYTYYPPV